MINAIRNKCSNLYKEDCKKMGLYLVRFDGEKGILRCRHTQKDKTINLLNFIEKIDKDKVKIKTIATSGTIKSLVKKHFSNI